MKFKLTDNTVVILDTKIRPIQLFSWKNGKLMSIIKRQKENRKKGIRPLGDNCPMLYAMKNSDGLITSQETISELFNYCETVLIKHFTEFPFDAVIVMPSSHSIGVRLAKILAQQYNVPIYTDYFAKSEVIESINTVIANQDIPMNVRQSIKTALSRNVEKLELKSVKTEYRRYIPVLKKTDLELPLEIHNVLLVDDIYSSGTTLNNARNIIKENAAHISSISALTLFGPLSTKYIDKS